MQARVRAHTHNQSAMSHLQCSSRLSVAAGSRLSQPRHRLTVCVPSPLCARKGPLFCFTHTSIAVRKGGGHCKAGGQQGWGKSPYMPDTCLHSFLSQLTHSCFSTSQCVLLGKDHVQSLFVCAVH